MRFTHLAAAAGFALFSLAPVWAAPAQPEAAKAEEDGSLAALLQSYRNSERNAGLGVATTRDETANTERYDTKKTADRLAARRRINSDTRIKLETIARSALNGQDRVSYDIFAWDLSDEAQELKADTALRFQLLPLNQFDGRHFLFARELQRQANTPLNRASDYDDAIKRMLDFSRWTDRAIALMREGIARGAVQPRIVVERMIAQIDSYIAPQQVSQIFLAPLGHIPAKLEESERTRIESAYREAVEGELVPAYGRLDAFLKTEYLGAARRTIGLSGMEGGREMYLYLVRSETTTEMTPDAIHALGLAELKRIESEMERVKRETDFTGTLAQFRNYLRSESRFRYKDEAAMLAEFNRIKSQVRSRLDQVFLAAPKTELNFRLYESYAAPYRPAAEYIPGSGNARRAATVFLNASELSLRAAYTSEALELHEGLPGHHLQVALALENSSLPRFRRFGGATAFVEGWALYAETLGPELGLYTDPYQKFGELSYDAWRASRLAVDTGIHWFGWTHEQAVAFLLAHTALSENEAVEETDRYIAIPAQALAYKLGERKILDLRARAKAALGATFDLRHFHDAVLKDGAMPLSVLDTKIADWIAAQARSSKGSP